MARWKAPLWKLSCAILPLCYLFCIALFGSQFVSGQRHRHTFRVDAITKLPNGTMILVSNGHYWILSENELPLPENVQGIVTDLHPAFSRIDAVFADPYNELDPKIYIIRQVHVNVMPCQTFSNSVHFKTRGNLYAHVVRNLSSIPQMASSSPAKSLVVLSRLITRFAIYQWITSGMKRSGNWI